jgi:hypothetical protein
MMGADDPLKRAGWVEADEVAPPTPYDRFVRHLGFSLQGEWLIQPPQGSAALDLREIHAGTEYELRRALLDVFRKECAGQTCLAINVNHGQWEFVPDALRVTSHYEPFPVGVTPYAEYVVFGNADFSLGVFCNPWNLHLIAFGGPMVARLTGLHGVRLAPLERAAWSGGAGA